MFSLFLVHLACLLFLLFHSVSKRQWVIWICDFIFLLFSLISHNVRLTSDYSYLCQTNSNALAIFFRQIVACKSSNTSIEQTFLFFYLLFTSSFFRNSFFLYFSFHFFSFAILQFGLWTFCCRVVVLVLPDICVW